MLSATDQASCKSGLKRTPYPVKMPVTIMPSSQSPLDPFSILFITEYVA